MIAPSRFYDPSAPMLPPEAPNGVAEIYDVKPETPSRNVVRIILAAQVAETLELLLPVSNQVGCGMHEIGRVGGLQVQVAIWPADQPPPFRQATEKPLTDCQRDCLAVIVNAFRTTARGLTTLKVIAALDSANMLHGQSTIVKALAGLNKRRFIRSTRGLGGYIPDVKAQVER